MNDCLLAALVSGGIVLLVTGPFERWLRRRDLRREVRVDTPESHQSKQGTPSMGGVVLCCGIALGCLAAHPTAGTAALVGALLLFGALGFWDDFVKATARPGFGLKARHKVVLQCLLAAATVWALAAAFAPQQALHLTPNLAPLKLGWAYFPVAALIVFSTSNSANLADGLDGLAAGVLLLGFAALCGFALLGGMPETAVFSGAAAAACLAFLWFNRHPARIWMGDTGSLALGAGLAVAALAIRAELLLPLVGIVLVIDALSVMLQVASFQTTGKRLFKIAPIHHAFELRGWPETRVVGAAWLLTGAGTVAATCVWLTGR